MNAVGEGVVRAALKTVGPQVRDVVRIELAPPSPIALAANATQQLQATAYDPAGGAIGGKHFLWQSSNSAVAVVNMAGMVTAKAAGTATIAVTAEYAFAEATVIVS
jgi:hypothetical protein